MKGDSMMKEHMHGHEHHGHCCKPRLSWTAVLVGALVGIGLSFLLNLFSIAIGLSAFTVSPEGMTTLAVGGFIGVIIGVMVSMFVAGFTAGFLGRHYCMGRNWGVIYGFTAWCLALLIMTIFVSHIGHYVSAYTNFVSHPTTIVVVDAARATTTTIPVVATISAEKATGGLALGAFTIFILFAIGALSACFGGYSGMTCCKKKSCE